MAFYIGNFGQRNRKLVLTPELLTDYGRQGLSREEIAKRHKVNVVTVNRHLEKVSLREAYEKGKKSA